MKQFDVLIAGGSVAGLSCALLLGSAKGKPFAADKKIGIIACQEGSALTKAELNNVLGFEAGTKGSDILSKGLVQLQIDYPEIAQLKDEKVTKVYQRADGLIDVFTAEETYTTSCLVLAVSPVRNIGIEGLESFIEPHPFIPEFKQKIMLRNVDHVVAEGIYAAGVIAGWRSQYAIAAGSGTLVGTHILSAWNNGNHTMIHDVIA